MFLVAGKHGNASMVSSMRMWNVDPKIMCRKHLLGEHVELHMFSGTIAKGISLEGYAKSGLVDVKKIEFRHKQLAKEMIRRGYCHKSPINMKFLSGYHGSNGFVDVSESKKELAKRCKECRRGLVSGNSC